MPGKVGTSAPALQPGTYKFVAWDLDTTGRRLIDEICQIGGYCRLGKDTKPEDTFSQYVMPYRNPNPGARRSFGIKVVNIGRYRMLKDMASGKILKTKSEVSALQDFISWLNSCRGSTDGVILVSHEPQRKVLGPLLLEALHKYHLLDSFNAVVKGFCNSSPAISALGDTSKITSLSLRSLCKTVLGDTTLPTNSAVDRCTALFSILAKVTEGEDDLVSDSKLLPFSSSVPAEAEALNQLKSVLGTQGTLRPIFESQLKQKRLVRERAMNLRRLVAEAGFEYSGLKSAVVEDKLSSELEAVGASKEDIAEIERLVRDHFDLGVEDNGKEEKKVSSKGPLVTAIEAVNGT